MLILLVGFVDKTQNSAKLKALSVSIDHADENYFVKEDEIQEAFVNQGYNMNTPITSINLNILEKALSEHPSIEKTDVYTTISGKLHIDVLQRTPLVRVYTASGDSYYIDKNGWLMPLSVKHTAKVPIANGNIKASYVKYVNYNLSQHSVMEDSLADLRTLATLYRLCAFISSDPFLNAQISQIFINNDREIELIPRVGNHTILFGDAEDIQLKFDKLKIFYKKGLNKTGWNNYSLINLKYKNQIVCKKI